VKSRVLPRELEGALQDCLELGGVVKNDTQVEILHVEREYGERSATYIEINAL
jgi:Holliday junction resolvase RusA-like endonuclease